MRRRRGRMGMVRPRDPFGPLLSCARKHTMATPSAVCELIEVAGMEAGWASESSRTPSSARSELSKMYSKLAAMSDVCKSAFEHARGR